MKPRRTAAVILSILAVFSVSWSATGIAALSEQAAPANVDAYQLLVNPGMEQVFVPYGFAFRDVACKVATGWTRFGGDVDPRPCWMDTRDFAYYVMGSTWVEAMDGTSQALVSTEPYMAGIYQQRPVTPGVPYGFHSAMLTIFQSSADPVQHGMMSKQVGMDPTGGIDPDAPTVVWSEPNLRDEVWDVRRRTAVVATSSTMTVFIRVTSPYASGGWPYVNQSFFDSAILAQTATVSAESPSTSLETTFTVRWDNAVASEGATIVWYDVQSMDEADGQWVDWLIATEQTQAAFTGERGRVYRFRARAWQEYPNGAHLYSPWAPEEGTPTQVAGAELTGQVLGNGPYAFSGTSVSILDTEYQTLSRLDGTYQMWTEPMATPQNVASSHSHWLSPEPVYGVIFGLGETVTLNWSLRPPDDAVHNGGFEDGLSGWASTVEQGVEPATVEEPVHTGVGAGMLGGPAELGEASLEFGYTSGLEQTVDLARSWNPNLAFWYLAEIGDSEDQFTVTLVVESDSTTSNLGGEASGESMATPLELDFAPPLDMEGWQHQWYSLGIGEAYFTGTVTICFDVWNDGDEFPTTVYLDEVSLGRTPGGPFRTYLPLIGK